MARASGATTLPRPLVLRAGADAILQLARRELGVELGVLILLHTWGQLMNRHVHGHCLVSGGGLSLDGQRCLLFPSGACLSLEQLAQEFRDLFLDRLVAYAGIVAARVAGDRE